MSTITLAPTKAYPATAVATNLHDELVEAVVAEALIRNIALPATPAEIARASVPGQFPCGGFNSLRNRADLGVRIAGERSPHWRIHLCRKRS